MIILGDEFVSCEEFYLIHSKEDIKNTKANSVLLFSHNLSLESYCKENNLFFAVYVSSVKEALYANALSATYIISKKDLSIKIQKIADNYMFDAKNITIISSSDEFEEIANLEIDGLIYTNEDLKNIEKDK